MSSLETIVANEIARDVHSKQKDLAGHSMLHHVYGVSRAVKHLGNDYVIVALLHDTIEDAGIKKRSSVEDQIKKTFSPDIIEAVYAITHESGEDYFNDYLAKVMQNTIAKKVKIADIKNNLSRMDNIKDPKKKQKLQLKYTKALEMIGESNE